MWESEVLVCAGGSIVFLRGLGLATGFLGADIALCPLDMRMGALYFASMLVAVAYTAFGVGVLCRSASCSRAVLFLVMDRVVLVLYTAPGLFHLGRPYELHKLAAQPVLLVLLPAYLIHDLFGAFAVFRREAEPAFRLSTTPLATIADTFGGRMTGRVLVTACMVALAMVSSGVCVPLALGIALL